MAYPSVLGLGNWKGTIYICGWTACRLLLWTGLVQTPFQPLRTLGNYCDSLFLMALYLPLASTIYKKDMHYNVLSCYFRWLPCKACRLFVPIFTTHYFLWRVLETISLFQRSFSCLNTLVPSYVCQEVPSSVHTSSRLPAVDNRLAARSFLHTSAHPSVKTTSASFNHG